MPDHTRILLIDDDVVDRMRVRRTLSQSELRFELVEAADGGGGLALARQGGFDCVLLDYRLPDMDAFDLLRDLLSPEGGRQAVMMLTGEIDQEDALRLMRMGALDHLAKAELTPSGLARAIRYAKARRGFVGELEAARRDAEAKSHALDILNRQKSLLFSIIAHDLRNPFQMLFGLSEVLGKTVATRDHASIERRAQGLKRAASEAHALMEGLFAWASLQMDNMEVVLSDFAIADMLDGAIGSCRDAAKDKGIALHLAGMAHRITANPDMVGAILRNLLSNAIKFTPAGGAVTIAAAREAGRVRLSVTDTGIGMSATTLEDIFRVDRRHTTKGTAGEPGSGLGLLLCVDLAERLGTRLEATSAPGAGTMFALDLPAACEADTGEVAAPPA